LLKRCVMTVQTMMSASAESLFDVAERFEVLLTQAKQEAANGAISTSTSARLADIAEALRSRLIQKSERDPRSLFDLDERLIELMNCAEEAAEDGGISQELLQEINDYLEAFRTKVDRIAGYCRWQESIAGICGEEAERLSARKRAAERRVNRLKDMLLAFMMSRGLKKLEGEKAAIGLQANSTPSLV